MDGLMPQLYDDLVSLCSPNDGFYYKDVQLDLVKYRIFNYNLCSYEQFQKKSALNCRGIMFDITDLENVQLVCLPPEKFFNYEEGDGKNIHSLGTFGVQMEKLDGSLISTYLHTNEQGQQIVKLKSKASLISTQATEAMNLLTGQYRDEVEQLVRRNYTINFEYTSPLNQIVLLYSESKLSVLSIRCHSNGETLFGDRLISFLHENDSPTILQNIVSFKTIPTPITHEELIKNIRQETEGEGYVVEITPPNQKSYLVKIKTEQYLRLHHTKFDRCSSRYFFECVIHEQTDDLRSLFTNTKDVLDKIKAIEVKTRPIYNQLIQIVELFYEENKHLSRKDYAIKASNTREIKIYMPLVMNLFVGKENDYKKFSIQHMKDLFHINDEPDPSIVLNNDN